MQIFLQNKKLTAFLIFVLAVTLNCKKVDHEKPAQNLKYFVIPEQCVDPLLVQKNFDLNCLKLVASKMVGLAIVYTGTIVKVPQLLKIFSSQSVAGLAFVSLFAENIAYAFSSAYNLHMGYPFSTYGENIFLMIQDTIILFCFVFYDKTLSMGKFIVYMSVYALLCGLLFSGQVPEILFQLSVFVNMGLLLFARIPQIYKIFKEKSTGQLSFITTICFFAGTLARLVTIFIEVDDILQKTLISMAAIANTTIFVQMLLYWNSGSSESQTKSSPQKVTKKKRE